MAPPEATQVPACDAECAVSLRSAAADQIAAELKRRYGRLMSGDRRLIFLGAPGSGKGTQSQALKEQFNLAHLSSGDMLREAVTKGTPLGKRVKEVIDRGELVQDELVLGLIEEKLLSLKDTNGFILDGFPRNQKQAELLDALLEKIRQPIGGVLFFDCPEQLIVRRVCGRRVHLPSGRVYHIEFNPPQSPGVDDVTKEPLTHRKDDTEDTVRNRLRVFHEETLPLIGYYSKKGLLHQINAGAPAKEVKETISLMLGRLEAAL